MGFGLIEDPDAASPPGRRLSFGALQIWVRGRNLTLGLERAERILPAAEVPLLPVAEWIIKHWDPLLHEERLPRRTEAETSVGWYARCLDRPPEAEQELDELLKDRERWWRHHGLGSALPDFRIPDLHFRRFGELVELSWDDSEWQTVPGGVSLLEEPGVARLPALEVAHVLNDWCGELLAILRAGAAAHPALSDELASLVQLHASLDDPSRIRHRLDLAVGVSLEREARRLRKCLGVTSGSIEETVSAMLGIVASDAAPSLIASFTPPVLLFRSASPHLSGDDLSTLLRLAERSPGPTDTRLERFITPAPAPFQPEAATEDGYRRALRFRKLLGIDPDLALAGSWDLELVLRSLLGVLVEGVHLDDRYVEGVAVAGNGVPATIAVNLSGRFTRTPWGRRMTLAHELCHLLHDVSNEGLVGVVSGAWADRSGERRANAFAAMLLAPEAAIERWLPRDTERWSIGGLRAAMRELGIGVTMLTWHLYNLDWITQAERAAWLQELTEAL